MAVIEPLESTSAAVAAAPVRIADPASCCRTREAS